MGCGGWWFRWHILSGGDVFWAPCVFLLWPGTTEEMNTDIYFGHEDNEAMLGTHLLHFRASCRINVAGKALLISVAEPYNDIWKLHDAAIHNTLFFPLRCFRAAAALVVSSGFGGRYRSLGHPSLEGREY